ncbi:MAG: YajQ family cyclic di-GMP-binding protein [Deltaproteobacteria bacterium]|nr:YajQ family cyclic di-GMP-binding protein [Deltaproteobacteria bacterium]
MPSFDIVSEVDMHEIANALDQANKEITNRFDLKNTGSSCQRDGSVITITSDSNFHLEQVVQVLLGKMAKRNVNLKSLEKADPVTSGKEVRQAITIKQGIETALGKKIIKMIKDTKIKAQASIQEDQVRVTGKKRDDLQEVIAMLKESDIDLPLQFVNFRD